MNLMSFSQAIRAPRMQRVLKPPTFTAHYDTFDFRSTVTQPRCYSLKPTTAPLTYPRTLIDLGKKLLVLL